MCRLKKLATYSSWVDVRSYFPPPSSVGPSVSVTDLVWVGDVGAAVAGVAHAISVPVQLVSVLDTLTVVQEVLQACSNNRGGRRCILNISDV